ncbi:MAG: hypothetical protein ACK5MB_00620 [Phycisphaerales bacterium]|jgi:hypothetical protein
MGAAKAGRKPKAWRGEQEQSHQDQLCPNRAEVLVCADESACEMISTADATDRAHAVMGIMGEGSTRFCGGDRAGAFGIPGLVPACGVDRFGRVSTPPLPGSRPRRYPRACAQTRYVRVRVRGGGLSLEYAELVSDDTRADDLHTAQCMLAAELGEDVVRLDPWARGRSTMDKVRDWLARQPCGASAAAARGVRSARAFDEASVLATLRQRERGIEDDRRSAEEVIAAYAAGGNG